MIDAPRSVEFPLQWDAPLDKDQCFKMAADQGLIVPRLYGMGFPHANCGGFCVKAGQASFALLAKHLPERYAEHAAEEESLRRFLGKDVAILRDRRGGKTRPLTMAAFLERIEGQQYDQLDFGGCGCFTDESQPPSPEGTE